MRVSRNWKYKLIRLTYFWQSEVVSITLRKKWMTAAESDVVLDRTRGAICPDCKDRHRTMQGRWVQISCALWFFFESLYLRKTRISSCHQCLIFFSPGLVFSVSEITRSDITRNIIMYKWATHRLSFLQKLSPEKKRNRALEEQERDVWIISLHCSVRAANS